MCRTVVSALAGAMSTKGRGVEFFATPLSAFLTILAIAFGISMGNGWLLLNREREHVRNELALKQEIAVLREAGIQRDVEINTLKDVMLQHWPGEGVRLNVGGDVNNSNLGAPGRDTGPGASPERGR